MIITKVTDNKQVELIVELAITIWHEHFTPIIGKNQVEYMLHKFQSKKSITQQINNGFNYFLLMRNEIPIGYVGIIIKANTLFMSKFYILSAERDKGFGKQTMIFIEALANECELEKISLTVNKNNISAIEAYQKMGFISMGTVIQDIGGGFVMDDYKMDKKI